jgi:predicted secreted protein
MEVKTMRRIVIITVMLLVVPLVALATQVPDTGLTICYDNNQEITCPSVGEPFYGQDAHYVNHPQSYTKLDANGNDLPNEATEWVMVRDNVTGLIWEVKTDDGSMHDRDILYNWYDAQDVFIADLNTNSFGGFKDWRLPTAEELSLIKNFDSYNPTIDETYFLNTQPTIYWSSTTFGNDPSYCSVSEESGQI